MDVLYAEKDIMKFELMKNILKDTEINLVSLKSVLDKLPNTKLPSVLDEEENGFININNLALLYYSVFNCPILVTNTSLCFENLEEKYWPKGSYSMKNGKEMTYDEVVLEYSRLAKKFGTIKARFRQEICFMVNETNIFYDNIPSGYFLIVDKPHKEKRSGCGLRRILVDINTNKYYYDMEKCEVNDLVVKWKYHNFFKNILNNHNYRIKR